MGGAWVDFVVEAGGSNYRPGAVVYCSIVYQFKLHYIVVVFDYVLPHCFTLHYNTLLYLTLPYITLHDLTLPHVTLHYITLLHYIT